MCSWSEATTCWSSPGGGGGEGGHSHWKGVWGCAAVMTPFFQTSRRSLAYQFTVNAPLLCPLFSIFRKFLHFQSCFGQNSSTLDSIFSKFSFLRPLFFKENPLPRPYILKPAWHTSTKKKLSASPPRSSCKGMLRVLCSSLYFTVALVGSSCRIPSQLLQLTVATAVQLCEA